MKRASLKLESQSEQLARRPTTSIIFLFNYLLGYFSERFNRHNEKRQVRLTVVADFAKINLLADNLHCFNV